MTLDRLRRAQHFLDRYSDVVLWFYAFDVLVALVGGWMGFWSLSVAWWVALGGLGVILLMAGLVMRWAVKP